MIKDTDKSTVTRRELRQFGLGLGVLFALIGSALVWNGNSYGFLIISAGLLMTVAFWCVWPGIRAFYGVWMKLAGIMARIMTTLLLTVMFLLVLTPIALLGRLCGQKFVDSRFRAEGDSYWEPRTGTDRNSCEKQS